MIISLEWVSIHQGHTPVSSGMEAVPIRAHSGSRRHTAETCLQNGTGTETIRLEWVSVHQGHTPVSSGTEPVRIRAHSGSRRAGMELGLRQSLWNGCLYIRVTRPCRLEWKPSKSGAFRIHTSLGRHPLAEWDWDRGSLSGMGIYTSGSHAHVVWNGTPPNQGTEPGTGRTEWSPSWNGTGTIPGPGPVSRERYRGKPQHRTQTQTETEPRPWTGPRPIP